MLIRTGQHDSGIRQLRHKIRCCTIKCVIAVQRIRRVVSAHNLPCCSVQGPLNVGQQILDTGVGGRGGRWNRDLCGDVKVHFAQPQAKHHILIQSAVCRGNKAFGADFLSVGRGQNGDFPRRVQIDFAIGTPGTELDKSGLQNPVPGVLDTGFDWILTAHQINALTSTQVAAKANLTVRFHANCRVTVIGRHGAAKERTVGIPGPCNRTTRDNRSLQIRISRGIHKNGRRGIDSDHPAGC